MEKQTKLMMKGFTELQEVINQKPENSVWNPPASDKISPSKASQVLREYYNKQSIEQIATPLLEGFIAEAENLQRGFFTRPGCPRYKHMATSTTEVAEKTPPKFNQQLGSLSTMTLSSQLSLDDWFMLCPFSEALDSSGYSGAPATFSQSLAGLQKWKSFTEVSSSLSQIRGPTGFRVPWYISALQEKDQCMQKLGAELGRLSRYEAECIQKEAVISVLREEVDNMQKQLEEVQRGGVTTQQEEPKAKETGKEDKAKESQEKGVVRGMSLPAHLGQKSIANDFKQEIERLKLELAQSDRMLGSHMGILTESLLKSQEELEDLEREYMEILLKEREEGREELPGSHGSREALEGEPEPQEGEVEITLRKLQESQKIQDKLYGDLEKVKNDYAVATGAISSLQRQLSFEGSQLRRAHAEQESLQKELRERGEQLEAMSTKFCNLREERKHEEMMGTIERGNNALRQMVSELESKLAEKTQRIEELQGDVGRLQAQLVVNQHHSNKQLMQQKELQKHLDVLQRVEQQSRVMLETLSSRFERFRSKIIQAAYSSPGTKSPQAEMGDEEVLEALQKIINDRLEFHQMLRQKGVKVPPLSNEPVVMPPPSKKKSGSK